MAAVFRLSLAALIAGVVAPEAARAEGNCTTVDIDVLPAGLNLVSATASSGTVVATPATNTVTWNGAIASGGTVTITITAVIVAGPGTTLTNQATINFDGDGNGTNESSAQTDDPAVGGQADPTSFVAGAPGGPQNPLEIPTLSVWGLLALAALVAAAAFALLGRRRLAG